VGKGDELTARLRRAKTVGLDTAIFIYAFECHSIFGPLAQAVFGALASGQYQGYVSVLALGEILTGAKKAHDSELVLRYQSLFQRFPGLTMYDADTAVMEWMSDLRARYGIPTPDVIHLGTALSHGAKAFLTNDARLQRVTEVEVLVLAEFV
jgi:predicted nucleic acid-binding protein